MVQADGADAAPSPGRAVRRRATTRAHLIGAAEALFAETGSTSVRVEAIVGRAGFTRGAFYSNFGSVDELFFAVYEQQADEMFSRLNEGLRTALDVEGTPSIDAIVHGVIGGLPSEEHWYAIRSVLLSRARHDETINALLREHTARVHETLRPLLLAAMSAIHRTITIDAVRFTQAVVAAHIGAVSQATIFEESMSLRLTTVKGVLLGLSTATPAAPSAPLNN